MKVICVVFAATLVLAGCSTSNRTGASGGDFAGRVDIGGGREMYLECRGAGFPTVILVSDLDGAADLWHRDEQPAPKVFPAVAEFTRVCVSLMEGAPREHHLDVLPWLTGHDWSEGQPVRDPESWHDYWLRTWGARGLLHVWDDDATDAVVAGLADEHWRPAEMCLKVAARHEVAGTGDGAAALAEHELPRVRAAAMRALAVAGDTIELELTATAIGLSSTAKNVTALSRSVKVSGDELTYTLCMGAVGQPLQHHLSATLRRQRA